MKRILLVVAVMFAVSACGGSNSNANHPLTTIPTVASSPIANQAGSNAEVATLTAAQTLAARPTTPTAATTPTSEPMIAPSPTTTAKTPTATPAAITDAAAVVGKLKAAGLPIGKVFAYTAATDPNHLLGRPNGYTSKVNFQDSRINTTDTSDPTDSSNGGSVEVYPTPAGAKARADYIQSLGQSLPMLVEYDYLHGGILLRLSQNLTPDQAKQYKVALAKLP